MNRMNGKRAYLHRYKNENERKKEQESVSTGIYSFIYSMYFTHNPIGFWICKDTKDIKAM